MTKAGETPLDLDDAFDDFMRNCYPGIKETSAQYRESRRVFFSALHLMYWHQLLIADRANKKEITDQEMLDELKRLKGQLVEFYERCENEARI